MDYAELAQLGAKIAEIGLKLKSARAERAEIDAHIKELEQDLQPLIVEHTKLLAEIVGSAIPTPTLAPQIQPSPPRLEPGMNFSGLQPNTPPQQHTPGAPNQEFARAEAKIRAFLRDRDPEDGPIGAFELSEMLKIDNTTVGTVMLKIREEATRRGGSRMAVEPS